MSTLFILLFLFVAGSVFGFCFEELVFCKKEKGDANLRRVFGCDMPALMIYGASLALLYGVGKLVPASVGLVGTSAIAAIAITAAEYVSGKASLALHGKHTWSYADWPLSFGDDYCCVPASLAWFAFALLFYALVG